MDNKIYDVKERSIHYSLALIQFLKTLDDNYIVRTIGKQLLRSGTSIGANIIEGQAASSKKDFTNYLHIALKSANETKYWLRLLRESEKGYEKPIGDLEKEVLELANILAKSIMTLKDK